MYDNDAAQRSPHSSPEFLAPRARRCAQLGTNIHPGNLDYQTMKAVLLVILICFVPELGGMAL